MDWTDISGKIIAVFGGLQVILTAAVAFLGKAWINRIHEQDKAKFQAELEAIRHQFQVDAERQKSRFVRLQDERIGPLLGLFSEVSELASRAESLQVVLKHCLDDDVSEDVEKLEEFLAKAQSAYVRALLFLPEQTAEAASAVISNWTLAKIDLVCA